MRLPEQSEANFFYFFRQKNFKCTKKHTKPKPTNKTKLREQETTKATIFCAENLIRGGNLFILRFGTFLRSKLFVIIYIYTLEIVLITSFIMLACTHINCLSRIYLYALICICDHL